MVKVVLIFLIFIILNSCESAKEGFTLQKQNRADEFLVKKKNPLVLPPEFSELPIPDSDQKKDEKSSSSEIKQLLKDGNNENNTSKATGDTQKIEQNILNKIKNR